MRLKSAALTETEVYSNDSGRLTIVPAGEITLGTSKFNVQRSTWVSSEEADGGRCETQLIGARGSLYTLVPRVNHKNEHFGEYVVVSMNTGQPMRKKGNVVRVIELGGIIEEKV